MGTTRRTVIAIVGAAVLAAGAGVAWTATHDGKSTARKVRDANDQFKVVTVAEQNNFDEFHDINGKDCIQMDPMPGMPDMKTAGGMGVHFVNGPRVMNPSESLEQPEALVYDQNKGDLSLHLAAVEYIVDKAAWDKTHSKAPELYKGHPFDTIEAPNRFGLPTFYAQHVWLWKHNPAGMFAMWNPNVHCP
jgi:hypothetical protein